MDRNDFLKTKEQLELDIKALQAKKQDAEKELQSVHNQKIQIIEEGGALRKAQENERLNHRNLADITSDLRQELASVKKEIAALEGKKKEYQKEFDEREKRAYDRDIESERNGRFIQESLKDLKKKTADVTKQQASADQEDSRIKYENDKLVNATLELKELQDELLGKKADVDRKNDEANSNIDKSKALLASAGNKNDEADKQLDALKPKEEAIVNKEKHLAAKEKNLDEQIEKNLQAETALIAKDKDIESKYDALATKEKEIEIQNLRLQKLIRDKGLSEELAQLEKELAK